MSYIHVENVSKKIHRKTVLDQIDLKLEKGRCYGFLGPNGSGKTMLFRAICGLIRPTQGEICIDGQKLHQDIDFPPSLGVLIESAALWPNLSGLENLSFLAGIRKKIDHEKIVSTLHEVGLDSSDKRPTRKYSLGMKQRLGIAQAIMEDPELLILDEPTNALDPSGRDMILFLLHQKLKQGTTILLSSHYAQDIEQICNERFEMFEGRIIAHHGGNPS